PLRAELRAAVIEARIHCVGSLAAHAAIALQERRLRGVHVEVEPEVLRRDPCREAISRLHERPVVDPYVGLVRRGGRETEAFACRALIDPPTPQRRISNRRVREQQLLRRETAFAPPRAPRG